MCSMMLSSIDVATLRVPHFLRERLRVFWAALDQRKQGYLLDCLPGRSFLMLLERAREHLDEPNVGPALLQTRERGHGES